MLTVTNNLVMHLVVPDGAGEGLTLKVPPRGQVQVERVTGPLKEAERHGLLTLGYPEAPGSPDRPNGRGGKKKGPAPSPEPAAESTPEEAT